MALSPRRPDGQVLLHSDQGCQYTGHEWQAFLRDHNLLCSMSRLGNCYDNAVALSFFQLLNHERIPRHACVSRADVFNHIGMFYEPKSRHSTATGPSPMQFEERHSPRSAGVQQTPGQFTSSDGLLHCLERQ